MSPDYYPLYEGFWSNKHYLEAPTDKKLLFIYLFSNASRSVSGIYPLPKMRGKTGMVKQTGIPEKRIHELLKDMPNILFDEDADCVFVTSALERDKRGGRPDLRFKAIQGEYNNTVTILWQVFAKLYPETWERLEKSNVSHLPGNSCPKGWLKGLDNSSANGSNKGCNNRCSNGSSTSTSTLGGGVVGGEDSPYYQLAKRIIESAAGLDAKGVGLNKDTPSQRERRILEAAEDIRKLIEVSWVRWDSVKAIKFANQIWDWVLKQYEALDGKGFTWRRNIRSGYKFRYHLDSQLKHRGKEGGELLRQYRASPEYEEIQRRAVAQKQRAKQKPEENTEPQRDEEAELKEILTEKGEKAWAVAYFEMLKITPEEARTNPILSEVPRTQKALKILGKTSTKEKK